MANNYLLKYKTFDELMAEISGDFRRYASNGMIDEAPLIKVAQKINKRLGNKLRREKEEILYVEKGRVRLPLDFHLLNFAVICYDYSITHKVVAGDQREIRTVDTVVLPVGCVDECPKPCVNPCVRLTSCGNEYEIIETTTFETRKYKHFGKLKVKSGKSVANKCQNQFTNAIDTAYIENKFLYTNFDEGKVYITYLGDMEDEDGNLIVLDHELVNDYYEYAIKQRMIENFMANGETIPQNLFQVIETRYKEAKREGESLINTPDFAEMDMAHKANREAHYQKYYRIFQ